jgi:hypothetical protein
MELSAADLERFRRSGITLDAAGRFIHEGEEVRHPGLRAALWRWLDQDADGRFVLRLDAQRFVYLDVEDAPHVVRSLRFEGSRALGLLADGSEEPIDLASVRLGAGGAAYCQVKGGRFRARLASGAWAALADRIVDEGGVAYLVDGGRRHRLGPPPG